jgi:hypothetical protein
MPRRTPLTEAAPLISPATGAFDSTESRKPAPLRPKSTGPRAGKKAVPFWIPEAAKRQLDLMTLDEDTTIQALLTEALNDLFRKRDKPPIA